MNTNFLISDKSVSLEILDITDTCIQIMENGDTNEKKVYIKLSIPIEEWKKIIKDWNENKSREDIKIPNL